MNVNIPSPSGASYTVYADVTTADAYMAAAFGDAGVAWRSAVTDDKSRALVSATRMIDLMAWSSGYPADTAWLAAIVNASIELAASLLEGSLTQLANQAKDPTRSIRAGSASIQYFRQIFIPSTLPTAFTQMMAQWLGSASAPSGSASYGVDCCSIFDQTFAPSRGVG